MSMSAKNQGSTSSFRSASGGPATLSRVLRRLGMIAAVACFGLYLAGVVAGYVWLRYSRGIESVGFFQVAFVRVGVIKRAIAAKQLVDAKNAWDAKNFQVAYVNYVSALRRDPANVAGRLEAARFFASMNATALEINLLEEGLALTPDNRELNDALFAVLMGTGRTRQVLELLHGNLAPGLTGPNAGMLQTAELQATLAVNGAPAARALLDRHPGLRTDPKAAPVVARVLWESGERDQAIAMISSLAQAQPNVYALQALLAGWQQENGQLEDAVKTCLTACQRFPREPAPRALLLEVASAKIYGSPLWQKEILTYLHDFAAQPNAIYRLAEIAGRKGWVDLAHTLYELGATRRLDLNIFALYYSDALAKQSRLAEARDVLAQVELQLPESNVAFQAQLRIRQVATAALLGEKENVREFARRLASLVRNDPDALEQYRQLYARTGLVDALAEFTEVKSRSGGKTPAKGT
jgi:hypothetical protein